ncbi:hypothetical protein CVT25_015843 [Psilocybe cyanescens]|uniref:DUF6533 domain-containing protein n=1 Tax=Psilocybe cyanescens TaxID=93625 RepID=A0A409XTB8_PSICY|nr:hypothetical protein CVT25_015843 [Psilocybe cyanescens]
MPFELDLTMEEASSLDLESMVRQGMAVNLVAAACLTALLYDHVLTLDVEVETMWRSRLSIPKVLFFLNRYVVAGMLLFNCISASQTFLSHELCLRIFHAMVNCGLNYIDDRGIIVLRVWALHRRNKWALRVAFFFYFGGSFALLGLLIQDYVGETVELNTALASLPGCYATSVPSIIAGQWLAPIIVETVLFSLVLSRAFFWWKDGIPMPRIFSILARDSTLYFSIVFALLLANYLMFELGPVFLSSLLVTPSTTAGCILGSHMLLNLRVMAGHKMVDDMGTGESTSFALPAPRRQRAYIDSVGILEGASSPYPYPAHTATVRDALDKVFESHNPQNPLRQPL